MNNGDSSPNAPNPYQASTSKPEQLRQMGVLCKVILLSISCSCFLVAAGLFVFAESWETYTPYSAEKHWTISFPFGSEIWIDASTGVIILISCLVVGLSLLFWALAPIRMSRRKSSR